MCGERHDSERRSRSFCAPMGIGIHVRIKGFLVTLRTSGDRRMALTDMRADETEDCIIARLSAVRGLVNGLVVMVTVRHHSALMSDGRSWSRLRRSDAD